ncbi:30S ribosomal protein S17 [Candidatus Collierbacteria bacterium CG17_big_fil_post_rev_8_21_14_2_50_45_7]|uniref:30S ribosomal protein S17 n=2 Tax=Candidatus Collieribacteriota TaxID=1752725 RepID=A0A2M7FP36_9BACT|nr:MAG: 30S ribosomal protein S17 [Candidatus Collierbacteria bacterium CG17_big_fil_post_rev_8_21_14_2_50_45_7]
MKGGTVKKLIATVVSTKLASCAVVSVETSWKHPLYTKLVRRSKKYLVQNDIKAKSGDTVEIQETRPLSARKHFTITKIIKK